MKKKLLFSVVAFAVLTITTSCSCSGIQFKQGHNISELITTPIGEIKENPQRFSEGTVTVRGQVSNPKGLGSKSVFTLRDHSGEILVYCKDYMAPAAGETVRIQGTVCMPLRFNDYKIVYIKQTQTNR